MAKRAKRTAPPPAAAVSARPARWRWAAIAVLALALAAWVAVRFRPAGPAPQLPAVSTTGLEPVVASVIGQALAEVRASPRSGAAWGRLGMTLQHYEFKAGAMECFAQAERFVPREPRWPHLHALLLQQDAPAAATAKLRRAATLCGDQPDAPRLRLAQLLAERGLADEAEAEFQRLLRARPDHAPALLRLAQMSLARARLAECTNRLVRCLNDPHTARAAHALLAGALRQLNDAAGAVAATRRAAGLPPDRPWPDPFVSEAAKYHVGRKAWLDQGELLLRQGRAAEAAPLITRAVNDYPAVAQSWLLLGRLRLEQQDCAGAEQAFRRHLQLAPDSVNGHAQLGIALLCLERYADAVTPLEQALQRKPDFGEAHFNLGFARARSGRGHEAIAHFRDAIRFNPEFVDPYITLADLLDQLGRKEEALALLDRAQALNPDDERVKALRARAQGAR